MRELHADTYICCYVVMRLQLGSSFYRGVCHQSSTDTYLGITVGGGFMPRSRIDRCLIRYIVSKKSLWDFFFEKEQKEREKKGKSNVRRSGLRSFISVVRSYIHTSSFFIRPYPQTPTNHRVPLFIGNPVVGYRTCSSIWLSTSPMG